MACIDNDGRTDGRTTDGRRRTMMDDGGRRCKSTSKKEKEGERERANERKVRAAAVNHSVGGFGFSRSVRGVRAIV